MSIDSALWAYHLGKRQREITRWTVNVRADRICPFQEGTEYRRVWYSGWRGQPMPCWP